MTLWRLAIALSLAGLLGCSSSGPAFPPPAVPPQLPTASLQSLPTPLVVSVLYFEDRTRLPKLSWLSKGLADMLITDLSQAPGLQVVQRERLEELVREQLFQVGGRVEEKTAVRIGRMTGATVLLLGSAAALGNTLRLDAHLYDVERGTVIGATSVEGQVQEVLSLEKQLAARILTFLRADFPISPAAAGARTREGAQALYEGVDAADHGHMTEALNRFEAALAKEPRLGEAFWRYERIIRDLNPETLWSRALGPDGRPEDRFRVGVRILDDLFREGFVADIRITPQADTVPRINGTLVELQIQFDQGALTRLSREIRYLHGRVQEEGDRLVIELDQPEIRAAFAHALAVPRRMFVHFGTPDGHQVAVYSQGKQWTDSIWMSIDTAGHMVVEKGRRLTRTVLLPDLAFRDASWPARVWMTLDAVPHERATIQVELLGLNEEGRETLLSPGARMQEISQPDYEKVRLSLTREFLERWDPPVWERLPGPGYLPSRRRSVIVVAHVRAQHLDVPQLAGSSGDGAYDQACLAAVAGADEQHVARLLATLKDTVHRPVRVRVMCDLLKDIPPLQEDHLVP